MLQALQGASMLGVVAPLMAADTPWTPRFFSAGQNETMIALGERIIPGSREALCSRVIDAVLAIDSEKNRRDLLQTIEAFDSEAQRLHQKSFQQLAAGQQDAILSAAATVGAPLFAEFGIAKEWTADAYWSSLQGLQELGSTGRMGWDSFPGCPAFSKAN